MDEPARQSSRPILLVGMPGSGKSAIGPLLAERLALPFHDSDILIEARLGMSVAQIFARHGEQRFRAEEKCLVAALVAGPPAVIAAGGGAFLDAGMRALATGRAISVWLDVDLPVLAARLRGSTGRPLLTGDGDLAAIKAERDPLYALASLRVNAANPPGEVVAAILAALAEPAR